MSEIEDKTEVLESAADGASEPEFVEAKTLRRRIPDKAVIAGVAVVVALVVTVGGSVVLGGMPQGSDGGQLGSSKSASANSSTEKTAGASASFNASSNANGGGATDQHSSSNSDSNSGSSANSDSNGSLADGSGSSGASADNTSSSSAGGSSNSVWVVDCAAWDEEVITHASAPHYACPYCGMSFSASSASSEAASHAQACSDRSAEINNEYRELLTNRARSEELDANRAELADSRAHFDSASSYAQTVLSGGGATYTDEGTTTYIHHGEIGHWESR